MRFTATGTVAAELPDHIVEEIRSLLRVHGVDNVTVYYEGSLDDVLYDDPFADDDDYDEVPF